MKIIDEYKKVLSAVKECPTIDKNMRLFDIEYAIKAEELYEEFGFGGKSRYSYNGYVEVSDYEFIAKYGEDYDRTIAWPDDDQQPDDEWLYVISFPTGAYVLGDYRDGNYPSFEKQGRDIFNTFFNELKKYEPKYVDTANNTLYFSASNAKIAHDNLYEIFNKYKNLATVENKKRMAEKLRKELEELEGVRDEMQQ